jgi:hypothetical protein
VVLQIRAALLQNRAPVQLFFILLLFSTLAFDKLPGGVTLARCWSRQRFEQNCLCAKQ